jgi:hypothetical protein
MPSIRLFGVVVIALLAAGCGEEGDPMASTVAGDADALRQQMLAWCGEVREGSADRAEGGGEGTGAGAGADDGAGTRPGARADETTETVFLDCEGPARFDIDRGVWSPDGLGDAAFGGWERCDEAPGAGERVLIAGEADSGAGWGIYLTPEGREVDELDDLAEELDGELLCRVS